jgi:peptidoglycan/xylan/chitin deacetylase (PgdA/CDA1 family)
MTRRSLLLGLAAQKRRKARIAITMDLEMSRNFPTWETTHWDYEKGNLDEDSKGYSLSAARMVQARGGRIHFFAVGRVFEQEDVGWLEEIVRAGHAVGNHTYDHVNALATRPEDVQFRFRRAPWLLRGAPPAEAIEENIRLCTEAMRTRLNIEPNGFRTPGGFPEGLGGRADVQNMLLKQGFRWVSSKYPRHPVDRTDPAGYLPAALQASQPYRYPETGLTEIPMSPVSDISAFRNGRWPLERFLDVIRFAVDWTIENGTVFDLLIHPSCIGVVDRQMRTLDLISSLVESARDRAEIVTLDAVATEHG